MVQKPSLRLLQQQLVPCVIAYINDRETYIPVRRGTTRSQIKKTKYQASDKEAYKLSDDVLWVKMHGLPDDLKEVCQPWEWNGIDEWDPNEALEKAEKNANS